jgi:hypothetical protein
MDMHRQGTDLHGKRGAEKGRWLTTAYESAPFLIQDLEALDVQDDGDASACRNDDALNR